ncbi:ABC-type multidrug transport system, ATPase component [Nonomuraea solani]|uniref:ABC-type multidrug transport system, ATPase component n=1 Tax=Nonomuraea solani TaxID=1144553 RepID=A0A1H6DK26_9ACTN|nr:ATP-binding cassette domain-containing protein [Nonomuraea solani]SEG85451.1 ABC-type multidrug transport system, ATPase component [Nonomuraea solani]
MTAIEVNGLGKSHQGFEAVRGISFEVAQGEIFALLGRNGAGKTTTVEVLAGFQRADGGTVRVLGLDPHADRAALRRRTGIMLQEAGFFPDLTVAQTVDTWRDFTAAPRPRDEALELAGLLSRSGTRVRQLSGGEKRRLDLALAVLGRPDVLFLDEPTAGMDPGARGDTWAVVRDLARQGTTILLTTHYLDEAQRLASSMAIMDEGRIVASGGMAETLAARSGRVSFLLPAHVTAGELPLPVTVEGERAICRAEDPDLAAQTLLTWAEVKRAVALLESSGIGVQAHLAEASLPGRSEEALAWGVREAVTNVLRHSRATTCTITTSRLEPDIEVVAEVTRGDEIVPEALRVRPDVAVVDIDLPVVDGITAAATLRERLPSCRILVLTAMGRPGHVRRALSAGIEAFLVKDAPGDRLAEAIRRTAAGCACWTPSWSPRPWSTARAP